MEAATDNVAASEAITLTPPTPARSLSYGQHGTVPLCAASASSVFPFPPTARRAEDPAHKNPDRKGSENDRGRWDKLSGEIGFADCGDAVERCCGQQVAGDFHLTDHAHLRPLRALISIGRSPKGGIIFWRVRGPPYGAIHSHQCQSVPVRQRGLFEPQALRFLKH